MCRFKICVGNIHVIFLNYKNRPKKRPFVFVILKILLGAVSCFPIPLREVLFLAESPLRPLAPLGLVVKEHWTIHFFQGTGKTRPCLTGNPVCWPNTCIYWINLNILNQWRTTALPFYTIYTGINRGIIIHTWLPVNILKYASRFFFMSHLKIIHFLTTKNDASYAK